jgi:CBS domain-containing protein
MRLKQQVAGDRHERDQDDDQQTSTSKDAACLEGRIRNIACVDRLTLRTCIPKEAAMKVKETMSTNVRLARPDQTIREAAQAMADVDSGVLPVGENDRLVGMITDRDIAVRGIAKGKGPDTSVRDVMTDHVDYCFEDQDVDEVAKNMGDVKVRRLPVLNRDKRLVGIISLGDIAQAGSSQTDEALGKISRPGGKHTTQRA